MFTDATLISTSGLTVATEGLRNDEEDSALAFCDYYSGNKLLGYIMRSPSGRKYSMKLTAPGASFKDFKTFIEAETALLEAL